MKTTPKRKQLKRRMAALVELERIDGALVGQRFVVPFSSPSHPELQIGIVACHDPGHGGEFENLAHRLFNERLGAALAEYREELTRIVDASEDADGE
jgi:hypothetical protein